MPDDPRCAAGTLPVREGRKPGSRCAEWDGQAPGWAVGGPLCETEVRRAERDVRQLVYDFIDLEQMIPKSLSQALDPQPSGKPVPPMPIAAAPEALQREIHYVLTLWEAEMRDRFRIAQPQEGVRLGAEVQRAAGFLAPRIDRLARIEPVLVYPRGCDDDPCEVLGWEAVVHLTALHQRARAMLGRTHRTTKLPAPCSTGDAKSTKRCPGSLYRDDPRFEGDPALIYCDRCDRKWTADEFAKYVGLLRVLPAEMLVGAVA